MQKYILVVLFVMCALQQNSAKKLEIKVLYEALCPDSIGFISKQLAPSYKDIAKYVNITFVPFGKSFSTKANTFECQHGPEECQGNRIQSCALAYLDDKDKQVEYVNCFMTSYWKNPGEYGQKCAQQVGIEWSNVTACYTTNMGMQLQLEAEKMTSAFNPAFIPTIIFNNRFDEDAQNSSLYEFRMYVCNIIKRTYPDACPALRMEAIQI